MKSLKYSRVGWLFVPVALYTFLVMLGLAYGGGWDLYEQVAMADRWPENYGYTHGSSDSYMPSSPYFPGTSLLLIVIEQLGILNEPFIYMISAATVIMALSLTFPIFQEFGGTLPFSIYLTATSCVTFLFLPTYLDYAIEWKPDTLAIIFLLLSIFCIENVNSAFLRVISSLTLTVISISFKQQMLGVYLAIALAAFFIGKNQKKWRSASYVFLGSIGLSFTVISFIPGALTFSMLAHFGRGITLTLDRGLIFALLGLLLLALAQKDLFGLSRSLPRTFTNLTPIRQIYLIAAFAWLLIGIAGFFNYGGNSGNVASGLFLFIPIAILIIENSQNRLIKLLAVFASVLLILPLVTPDLANKAVSRRAVDFQVKNLIQGLDKNNVRVLLSGESYWATRGIEMTHISEFQAWGHLRQGFITRKTTKELLSMVREVNPDIVVCQVGCEKINGLERVMDELGFRVALRKPRTAEAIAYVRAKDSSTFQ